MSKVLKTFENVELKKELGFYIRQTLNLYIY
jgi:hypothetical protein